MNGQQDSVDRFSGIDERTDEVYRNLFRNSRSPMLIIQPESGDILDANEAACSFYRRSRDELTSMSIVDINVLSAEEVRLEMENARKEVRNYFRFRHELASGELRDVDVFSSPIELGGRQVLYSIIHDVSECKRLERERVEIIGRLDQANREIKALKGILPLCSYCSKIRDDDGNWEPVDHYLHRQSGADISHGICPDCLKDNFPDYKKG